MNDAMSNFYTMKDSMYFYDKSLELWDYYNKTLNLNVHYIHYSDIIQDFKNQINNLLDFLNLRWEDNLFDYYKKENNILTPSYSQVIHKPYTKSINRWKNYKDYININILEKWIDYFGYEK
jgi:glutaredoxin-related protein